MSQIAGAVEIDKSGYGVINFKKQYIFITLDGKEIVGEVSSYGAKGSIVLRENGVTYDKGNLSKNNFHIGQDGWLFDLEEMTQGILKYSLPINSELSVLEL